MKNLLERGKKFVRELSESLCRKINERLFTDEKITELIVDTLNAQLDLCDELSPDIKIEYDIIDDFTAEDYAYMESQEKGATADRLLAITSLYDAEHYLIQFALEAMKNSAFKLWPWQVKRDIQGTVKHEAFHVRQYNYICQRGGLEAIDRVVDYMAETPYEDNILEAGAYLYQWFDYVQDFESCFEQFIIAPTEAEQPAA